MQSYVRCIIAIIFSSGFYNGVFCKIHMKDQYRAVSGVVFPNHTEVIEGQNMMFKLLIARQDQESCLITSPDFLTQDLRFKNSKIEHWSDGCGVMIKNVQKSDQGRWRLKSKGRNGHIEGIFTIMIKELPKDFNEAIHIDLLNEDHISVVDIHHYNSTYCYLTQKETREDMFIHGNCSIHVRDAGKNLQGSWMVHTGIPGVFDESITETHVNINFEEVDVGMTVKGDVVHMRCNLKYSTQTLDFCRFQRSNDARGFNLEPGTGKDYYSYYGAGLFAKECGLTIEKPRDVDYGSWKCSLGVTSNIDNSTAIIHRSLILHNPRKKIIGNRTIPRETLGSYGNELKINCNAGTAISYCIVKHPNETEFTPRTIRDRTESPYWYTVTGYGSGDCVLTIKAARYEDSGTWQCFMGAAFSSGPEIVTSLKVRVGSPLAAVYPIESVKYGQSTTLSCVTAGGNYALNYCRFLSPDGIRFNIDKSATEDKLILDEFYYPKDASLFRGDCAVTITKVTSRHLGKWTCAATIDKHNQESSDFILLVLEEANISAASATGIAIGLIVVVGLAGGSGYFVWKKKQADREVAHRNLSTGPASPAEPAIQYIGRPSADSDTSTTQLSPEIRIRDYGASTSVPLS